MFIRFTRRLTSRHRAEPTQPNRHNLQPIDRSINPLAKSQGTRERKGTEGTSIYPRMKKKSHLLKRNADAMRVLLWAFAFGSRRSQVKEVQPEEEEGTPLANHQDRKKEDL